MRFSALLAFLVLFFAPARAFAHASDQDYTLTITCDLDDGQVVQVIYVPTWFLMNEVYGEQTTLRSLIGKEADCKAQVAGWMAYNNPVLVDGVAIKPQVAEMEARSNNWPENQRFPQFAADTQAEDDNFTRHNTGLKITLNYPLKKPPATLSILWRRHLTRTLPDGSLSQPPVSLAFFHDGKHRITDLTAAEPEWVWHSEATSPPPASALVSQKWEPKKLRLPVGALAIALGGLTVGLLLWRKNRMIAAMVLLTDLGMGAFIFQAGIGTLVINSPFQKQLARPDEAQARVILDDLLHGVYKAFDYNKDAQIYDALAHCVDGPLLEKIYHDVHGSLVMDDQEGGGAVCQVEKVEITKAELKPATTKDADELRFTCAWTVRGKVSHWGHTHLRANAYEAQYVLAPRAGADGPRWKIVGCTVTQEKPLEVTP